MSESTATDLIASPVPQVLFVCVHNSGQSQIAAALLAYHAGDEVEVHSAGSLPGSEVHRLVFQVLAERGIDLAGAYPKPLTDDVVRAADYVITMGCGDACPVYPAKRYLDWEISDPADATPERVRQIVEEIDERVRSLRFQVQDSFRSTPTLLPLGQDSVRSVRPAKPEPVGSFSFSRSGQIPSGWTSS